MLEKLNSLKGKKVEILLKEGRPIRCIPKQYLEEEYESYLVELFEESAGFQKGTLMELEEEQIKEIRPF
ncbi:hypothetical protein OEV98_11020 [Caldibacillus lycopersici]|uniref:Uncharacterized protein n=1 Tax=Perspicuibacillus lycopersici TaxID=1325689 RepID=A0AAE3IVE9_9BACI|nr:hypothetical protein [Perspicuibacillus lycopersici]MCU9614091.1 hypothetical protein [Perspicuibacillus lycopersici]